MLEDFSNISVGELARASGIAASAVRYYESLGLIKGQRSSGGQRRYGPDALDALRVISFARSAGFTLAEITTLQGSVDSGGPLFHTWRGLAEKKLAELDDVIARAQEMKRHLQQGLDCCCVDLEGCPLVNGSLGSC